MQEDSFPAAEKILSDIENIFKKDPKLKLFEILPVTSNENRSPVVHFDHCLGLESWCISHVYHHSYSHLMSIRQNRRRREDPQRVNKLLMGALMINPEITSFWNMRKEMMMSGKLNPHFELHFTLVILSRKPKCSEVYSHRKWIIKNLFKDFLADPGIISGELHICEMAADHYSNNYHAWTHRIWCLSQETHHSSETIILYQKEWFWSEKWVSIHVSDHSGFQYRQFLLLKLVDLCKFEIFEESAATLVAECEKSVRLFLSSVDLKESEEGVTLPLRLVILELMFNSDLINNYPGHEALWVHRRFLFHSIKNILFTSEPNSNKLVWGFTQPSDHLSSEGVPLEKDKRVESCPSKRLALLVSTYERAFLDKFITDLSDPIELKYSNRHRLWLERFSKLQLPSNLDLLK